MGTYDYQTITYYCPDLMFEYLSYSVSSKNLNQEETNLHMKDFLRISSHS